MSEDREEAIECALGRFSCQGSKAGAGCSCIDFCRRLIEAVPPQVLGELAAEARE